MTTALLLSLLALGAPGNGAVRATGADDPAIQIWISNDRRFLPGDRAKVQVRTREDGYLVVFHVAPDGSLRVLFPLDPGDDDFIRGGRKYDVRGRGGRESFTIDDHRGRGTVYAAVSHDPFKFDQFVLGDHWDYRNLAPQRLSSDPEQELNELVRRMVDNSFDYDILSYDVLERVVYASEYNSDYYSNYYPGYYGNYGGCGYGYFGCGRPFYGSPYSASIGLFFGHPYRRFYYAPFYASYDPFYDPFFFDPYYYRPYYSRPYVYRTVYYPTFPYYGGFYNHNYPGWGRPYTPYRFRPASGSFADYRDRRLTGLRSVNTVYLPPRVRGGEPATATPMRRVADGPAARGAVPSAESRRAGPTGAEGAKRRTPERNPTAAPSRDGGRRVENRLTRPGIDARRAREPEETRSVIPDSRDRGNAPNLPTEIRPKPQDATPRRAMDHPDESRGGDARQGPQVEARPSRAHEDSRGGDDSRGGVYSPPESRPQPQAEPRRAEPPSSPQPVSRPEPQSDRGGDRGSYSPPARSAPQSPDGGSRGGWSGGHGGSDGGGGGGSGGGGGFRRR